MPSVPDGAIPITDRETYLACPDGRIYSTRSRIFLKLSPGNDGRLHVELPRLNRKPGELSGITVDVAKIVCTAFHGERPEDLTVSHLNGDNQDNRAENLLWEPLPDNLARRYEHGTMYDGFNNSGAKLSPKNVACIMAWNQQGVAQINIARALGVSKHIVSRVIRGQTYTRREEYKGEVPECPFSSGDPRMKLTEDQIVAIRNDGRLGRVIAAEYGISESHVSSIRNRTRRRAK